MPPEPSATHLGHSEHTFRVEVRRLIPVTTYREEVEVVAETDDWLEAERAYSATVRKADRHDRVNFEGVHPTHDFQPPTNPIHTVNHCSKCGAPEYGCYASHAPCGFEFDAPMRVIMDRGVTA